MGKIADIQRVLGVTPDGVWGRKSQAALDAAKRPVTATVEDRVDDRSETTIATLEPIVQPLARKLVQEAADKGITIKITSGTRTYEDQDALYQKGRTTPGNRVTNARGGYSNHNFGVAFDVTIFEGGSPRWESPAYRKLGEIGKHLGLLWGGDWTTFPDEPHFEWRPDWAKNLTEKEAIAVYRERKSEGIQIV